MVMWAPCIKLHAICPENLPYDTIAYATSLRMKVTLASLTPHRYFDFVKINKQQDEPLVWPLGADVDTFEDLDQFNIYLDLISILPESRVANFLFELEPGENRGGMGERPGEGGI